MLSIIIPVYNVEKYIEACLDSILQQNGLGLLFEVIIINDGSPDKCDVILKRYQEKYPQITIVSQENQGLSSARNKGLSIAKGQYVWFIDSDDTIVDNCIESIITSLKNDIDILQLNYQLTYEDGTPPNPVINNHEFDGILTGQAVLAKGGLPAPAPFSIYRRSFLIENSLAFVPRLLHEDSEFKPRATYLAHKIMWHKPIVYNYLQRGSGNITSSFSVKNALDILTGINNLHTFRKNTIKETCCIRAFRKTIGLNMNTLLYGMRKVAKDDKTKIIAALNGNKYIFKEMVQSRHPKYVFEGIAFMLNTKLGIRLHNLLR